MRDEQRKRIHLQTNFLGKEKDHRIFIVAAECQADNCSHDFLIIHLPLIGISSADSLSWTAKVGIGISGTRRESETTIEVVWMYWVIDFK